MSGLEPFDEPVARLLRAGLPFPIASLSVAADRVIVLFDSDVWLKRPGQFHNLRAYDFSGGELWRADLPTSTTNDHFVSLLGGGLHEVVAHSFSGFKLRIDVATGAVLNSEFVK